MVDVQLKKDSRKHVVNDGDTALKTLTERISHLNEGGNDTNGFQCDTGYIAPSVKLRPEFKRSLKGKSQLILNGDRYYQERVNNDIIYWKCTQYRSKRCTSRAITNGSKLVNSTAHSHQAMEKEKRTFQGKSQESLGVVLNKKPPQSDKTLIDHYESGESYESGGFKEFDTGLKSKGNANATLKNKFLKSNWPTSTDKSIKIYESPDSEAEDKEFSSEPPPMLNSVKKRKSLSCSTSLLSCKRRRIDKGFKSLPQYERADTSSSSYDEDSESDILSEYGIADQLIDYGDWDDPNIFVDRLRVLTSKKSNKLSDIKEISLIISELRSAGLIY